MTVTADTAGTPDTAGTAVTVDTADTAVTADTADPTESVSTAGSAERFVPTEQELAGYARDGFHVARGVFSRTEVEQCRRYFDEFAARGIPVPGRWEPAPDDADPLARYPRVIHPHMFDAASLARMLDPRIHAVLRRLLGEDAVGVQTMYYYKPPGSRGQAFHQDNFYLRVAPSTCIAAWTAIDPSTPENGGLQVIPGTQNVEVACPEVADGTASFTRDYVAPPPGAEPVKLWLDPGDVLFFGGSVIHGSDPNHTPDRWRRSFICHYMPASATSISEWYAPYMFDFHGHQAYRELNPWGGPCGAENDAGPEPRGGTSFH